MPPSSRVLQMLCHVLTMMALICFSGAAHAERRVAFVVGNEAYTGRDLPRLNNPAADAALIAATLERLGFEVWPKGVRTDLTRDQMEAALRSFREVAQGAEIGLIYFAGHGMQDSGENHLFPVDADPYDLSSLQRQSFTLNGMMASLSGVTRLKIGLFDACRDNRLVAALRRSEEPTRAAMLNRGMAPATRLPQSIVVFPTTSGEVTPDGAPGGNSPFAKALARHLPTPGLDVRRLFGYVAQDVEQETGRHRPEYLGNIDGDEIYLAMTGATPPPPFASSSPRQPPAIGAAIATQPTLSLSLLHNADVDAVAFSPDGTRILTTSRDGEARVWETSSGRPLLNLQHGSWVWSGKFNRDVSRILTGSLDRTARIWDARSGHELLRLPHADLVPEHSVWDVAISPDEAYAMTGSGAFVDPETQQTANGGSLRIWDAASGNELFRLPHSNAVLSAAFNPDGLRLLSASGDFAIIWDFKNRRELVRLPHEGNVQEAVFSPDGYRILTGSLDKTARIWLASTAREMLRLQHEGTVLGVAFSPDGKHVLTGGSDKVARVWDAETGQELHALPHEDVILSVAFSPDGRRVLTGSADGKASLWNLP